MRSYFGHVAIAGLVAGLGACSHQNGLGEFKGKVGVSVAPLQLDNVFDAVYDLTVRNGANEIVWQQTDLRSSKYGAGDGSLTYVGPCDSTSNDNSVTVELTKLEGPGGVDLAGTWQNPTPVTLDVTCIENTDVTVVFNLVIMRDAQQGFFDIAVNFEDIFCSAKLDCENDLLHTAEGVRDRTIVMAFACTAGEGEMTYLHMSDLLVQCDNGTFWIDPTQGPGQAGPVGVFFETAFYRGAEQFQSQDVDKCYWNIALGITEGPGAENCHLLASATASASNWPTGSTPANTTYPFISWDIDLTGADGLVTCGQHPMNSVEFPGVGTEYTAITGATFTHEATCDGGLTTTGRMLCGNMNIQGNDAPVAFIQTADGVSVTVGDQRSDNFKLPAGYSLLDGCCTNDCCSAP